MHRKDIILGRTELQNNKSISYQIYLSHYKSKYMQEITKKSYYLIFQKPIDAYHGGLKILAAPSSKAAATASWDRLCVPAQIGCGNCHQGQEQEDLHHMLNESKSF